MDCMDYGLDYGLIFGLSFGLHGASFWLLWTGLQIGAMQFVVAKHDTNTNSNNISSKDSKNKTQEFFVNLAQRWQHIRWNNNAGGNKVSSHSSDT